jgi:hypothetical protein
LLSFVSLVVDKLLTVGVVGLVLWFLGWLCFEGLGALGLA